MTASRPEDLPDCDAANAVKVRLAMFADVKSVLVISLEK
jgi:hypothetical protein